MCLPSFVADQCSSPDRLLPSSPLSTDLQGTFTCPVGTIPETQGNESPDQDFHKGMHDLGQIQYNPHANHVPIIRFCTQCVVVQLGLRWEQMWKRQNTSRKMVLEHAWECQGSAPVS